MWSWWYISAHLLYIRDEDGAAEVSKFQTIFKASYNKLFGDPAVGDVLILRLLYSVANWSALFLRTVNKHKKPDWIECLVACPSRPVLFQYRRLSDKTTHFDNMLFVVGLCSTQIPTSVSSYELSVPRTFPALDQRRPSFSSRRCTHPKQSSAAYHVLRHFLSSALAWRHTSSNCVTHNYCYHAREVTLSFMDMLIALTYLLPEMLLVQDLGNYLSTKCQVKI